MTAYVDDARNPLGRMLMSHMMADTAIELFDMADAVGLKREWFQDTRLPHYDLSQTKRALAVKMGAIEVTSSELVRLFRSELTFNKR